MYYNDWELCSFIFKLISFLSVTEMLHQAQGAAIKAKKAAKPSRSAQAAANAAASADSVRTY